jgi:ABC-type antimicrobial peptide transport system permease subunit
MDKGKEMEVKRLGVLSTGKILALLGAFGGFLLGIVLSFVLYKAGQVPGFEQTSGMAPFSTGQLIVLPFQYLLIFGILAGLLGLLFAWFYNVIAKSGGLKIELK